MIYTRLPKLDVEVSRLGFGCMRFPTLETGGIDRKAALAMIDLAYQAGVNYFDTAYGYHDGESEDLVREALARYPRESYYLADKLPLWLLNNEQDVERLLNEQLEKCGVEYFDFYLLHAADRDRWATIRKTRTYEQLLQKKREGVIRALGFSYHGDFDTFCDMVDSCEWDFVQIQINYVDYHAIDAKAYHDKLTEKGIPCVVMEPVRGGFLAAPPEQAVQELAEVNADSPARWALRWCLDMHNMPVILSGMSTPEQVQENLATFAKEAPFSDLERAAIERAREKILSVKTIPCTTCGYCMDCSFGVDIPGVFNLYNQFRLFQNAFRTKANYEALTSEHDATACTQCGACVPMCPQGIDIPARLAEVDSEIQALEV